MNSNKDLRGRVVYCCFFNKSEKKRFRVILMSLHVHVERSKLSATVTYS